MKNVILVITLTILVFSHTYGEESISFGTKKYGQEKIPSLQSNGSVILEGTKVVGKMQVNGTLKANDASIGILEVNGQVELRSCVIKNFCNINGFLVAHNTQFENELIIASQKAIIQMCSVNTLIVKKIPGFEGIQIVDLTDGTFVNGPIVVESGTGEIWISENSKILFDKVIGANIIKK